MGRPRCRLALAVAALALVLSAPAAAQDRARTREVVVGLGAEPRTMLAVTIVDWTTNNMLEHIDDRLLDRDPKTFRPRPMLATAWRTVNDTTWEFTDDYTVQFISEKPWPNLIDHASLTNALIMPAKALRELGPQKLAQHPIGTGPFRFVE